MNESTFGIHEVEFVVNAGEHFCDGGRVANHTYCAHYFRQITARHDCGWLVVDAAFEARWAPINELDCSLRLDGCDGRVHILWYDIATIHQATRHVLAMTRVALYIHGCGFEHGHGN